MSGTYLVTGATGLVGSAVVGKLLDSGENVVAYVRDADKARTLLANGEKQANLTITEGPLENINIDVELDYIIHTAAPTSSNFFIEKPVETLDAILDGTKAILNLSRSKKVKSVVTLSSMEVYGTPSNEEVLTEDKQFYLDPLKVRSNYPLAKRVAENMCIAYEHEYGVPVKIARLAQVIGRAMPSGDNRMIAQFIRAALQGEDIRLATDGMTKQTYVGIDDTVSAILTLLHDGKSGHAYNVANESTYCSIYDLAKTVATVITQGKVSVLTNTAADVSMYPPNRTLRINAEKLELIGWHPTMDLKDMIYVLAQGKAS